MVSSLTTLEELLLKLVIITVLKLFKGQITIGFRKEKENLKYRLFTIMKT